MAPGALRDCWRHCDALGVARVRLLLARPGRDPQWRAQAQAWLQHRLARQGRLAYWAVLGGIGASTLAIVLLALR
jgi:hypothetical protein